jgi:four helix bundle protein
MQKLRTHKDLSVWRKSVSLASKVYSATERFPNSDRYTISAQMRRSAVSVASNIAEGAARGSRAEYIRFLNIARGSLSELETQICICVELHLIERSTGLEEDTAEIERMLSGLTRKLREHRERANAFSPDRSTIA